VREGFSRDLGKLRETAERTEGRLRASEKRALLEIDRERGVAAKLQKKFDETTKRADSREADHRRALAAGAARRGAGHERDAAATAGRFAPDRCPRGPPGRRENRP
jgi:hypothetical protein